MVQEGVVLEHLVSGKELEVDKAKIEVIQNLPLPATIRDLWSFSGMLGSTRDSYKSFQKSLCHSPSFFVRTKISSSTKEGSMHLMR